MRRETRAAEEGAGRPRRVQGDRRVCRAPTRLMPSAAPSPPPPHLCVLLPSLGIGVLILGSFVIGVYQGFYCHPKLIALVRRDCLSWLSDRKALSAQAVCVAR